PLLALVPGGPSLGLPRVALPRRRAPAGAPLRTGRGEAGRGVPGPERGRVREEPGPPGRAGARLGPRAVPDDAGGAHEAGAAARRGVLAGGGARARLGAVGPGRRPASRRLHGGLPAPHGLL